MLVYLDRQWNFIELWRLSHTGLNAKYSSTSPLQNACTDIAQLALL